MSVSVNDEKNRVEKGCLYLVATPIGNLSDISERAVKVLSEVDFVAAEDTRNTGKLLSALGISKSMTSYYEHNKKSSGESIIRRLKSGESCALVTDAGTPAISDPGEDIVRECIKENIKVTSLPGACAVIVALTLSGMDTRKFTFEGFLPVKGKERKEALSELALEKRTLILYEAPHKLKTTLEDLLEYFGDRNIALCRELTKLNEEVMRVTISEALKYYTENDPRGEYVLVLEGTKNTVTSAFWQEMTVPEHIDFYVTQGMKKMDAIKQTAKDRGVPKNDIYKETLK
ncbi:MAG: 16S rRNA (cytidine(1402)-2'-O)-methyltransferase [Ruminococcaceae bacterium]|nr:16S rRNA (cytidine(1402)-2'-O)-methyltransferase [Oscillospiraceae bacterium]MBE6965064.1 16S rRNA (cytidine(1402)-2'-O)-methyltransferase [Oscillospiraceae bacterium]